MEELGRWLIAIAVVVIVFGVIFILRGKGAGALEFIKNIFRFKS